MIDAPRGRYIGKLVGARPKDEAEHFIKCPTCGGWIDCRDLGQVFEHEGPLPHPAQDRRNDHEKAPLRVARLRWCSLIKESRVCSASSSHSRALARYSSALLPWSSQPIAPFVR
jgi:Zn-finger nucleic acid-binding protein